MNYTVVDSCEWTYPDIHSYKSGAANFTAYALRGGAASCRLHIWNTDGSVKITVRDTECNIFEELAIPVEANPNFTENTLPHFPERTAPFLVYDCMKPYDGEIAEKHGAAGVYLLFPIAINASDIIKAEIIISDGKDTAKVSVKITPMGKMPAETLKIAMGYNTFDMHKWHNVEIESKEFDELDTKYLKMLRHQHQNRLFIDPPEAVFTDKDGWKFSFESFNSRVKKAISLGFNGFHITGVGFRRAWDKPDIVINGMDSTSYEAYVYLKAYMKALKKNLIECGWLDDDMFSIGIADEPNEFNATTYRAVAGMVRKLFPEIKIYDAVSYVPVYGAIDIWVPRSDEYEKNRDRFDSFRDTGDEVWHYVCLYPRDGGYINRFMDIPLLATRYLYWANYKYKLDGYLHWTVNCYEGNLNPFEGSCPLHINAGNKSILPPGDDKLIYPGESGPWMSARLEAQRESAQDYEMLRALEVKDKAAADKICESCFHSFNSVEFDPLHFRACHNELICEYSKYY